jgi:alpha-glucoside transport system permease protein
VSSTGVGVEFPAGEAPPPPPRANVWRRSLLPLSFLGPALLLLFVWIVYPMVATMYRSLFNDRGTEFVWFDNYEQIFTEERLQTALKNNALWVLIVPAAVTAVGLVFAVLTERIVWSTAFKISVFMPLAISAFAVGIIWRIMYQQDPDIGAINAGIATIKGEFASEGVLTQASPSTNDLTGSTEQGFELQQPLEPGDVALLGLTAIRVPEIPEDAEPAVKPEPLQGGINGVVWRDFKPGGGGTEGEVDSGELGIPGVTVELRDSEDDTIDDTKTETNGTFAFDEVEDGQYHVRVASTTFAEPFKGVNWLGDKLITPAIMIAFIWFQAGFAMVITAAGLASIPRDTLEAARTDGASEWQVFRRITIPLLAPVLTVVFVTQIIGVLKLFDLILSIAPGSTQDEAATLAFVQWQVAFSGQNRFGLGAAIATFILILFIPFLIVNVRRFRADTK